jgi:putative transposase
MIVYEWRKLNPKQRAELLALRKTAKHPWHSVPHWQGHSAIYMFTAACYEHKHVAGLTAERMSALEHELLEAISPDGEEVYGWCVLPNHYHAIAFTHDVDKTLERVHHLHGRTSFYWNGEENTRGRKVWCGCAETIMKSPAHLIATINYVHHNPVRHGYCKRWDEWPFSSASDYVTQVGREEARRRWQDYPIDCYGDNWDPPSL